MAKKNSKPVTTIKDFSELQGKLLELANHERVCDHAEIDMNKAITSAKELFLHRVEKDALEADRIREDIETFCREHKTAFDKDRIQDFVYGKVGYRQKPQSVAQVSKKYTWKKILVLVKRAKMLPFVRAKEEIDKDEILKQYKAKQLTDAKLASVGMKISADDEFVLEIDWVTVDAKGN